MVFLLDDMHAKYKSTDSSFPADFLKYISSCLYFWDRISLWCPACPWTCYALWFVLKLLISLPLCQVLRSQTRQPIQQHVVAAMKWWTVFSSWCFFFSDLFVSFCFCLAARWNFSRFILSSVWVSMLWRLVTISRNITVKSSLFQNAWNKV